MSDTSIPNDTNDTNGTKKIQDNELDGVNLFVHNAEKGGINIFVHKSDTTGLIIAMLFAVCTIGFLFAFKQKQFKKTEQ